MLILLLGNHKLRDTMKNASDFALIIVTTTKKNLVYNDQVSSFYSRSVIKPDI